MVREGVTKVESASHVVMGVCGALLGRKNSMCESFKVGGGLGMTGEEARVARAEPVSAVTRGVHGFGH